MSDEIIYREYQDGDELGIIDLLKTQFKGRTIDYWRWMYLDNPSRTSVVSLAFFNGNVVGCHHAVIRKIKIIDRTVLSAYGLDTLIHQEFMRRGIFTNLRKLSKELQVKKGIDFFFSHTVNPIIVNYNRKVSEQFPYRLEWSTWIDNVGLHFKKNPHRYRILMGLGIRIVKYLNGLMGITREKSTQISISDVSNFDSRFNLFCEKVSKKHDFILERDQNYLNWRYADPRSGEHYIKQAEEQGNIVGYIVYKIDTTREDYPFGHIVDLLVLPDRHDVLESLLTDTLNWYKEKSINICNCMLVAGHSYRSIFKRLGFFKTQKAVKDYVFYNHNILDEAISIFQDSEPERILLTIGDMFLV